MLRALQRPQHHIAVALARPPPSLGCLWCPGCHLRLQVPRTGPDPGEPGARVRALRGGSGVAGTARRKRG